MPINSLTLDPRNPAFKDAIMGCKEGDEVTLEVTGTVVKMGASYVLDVKSVESTAEADSGEMGDGEMGYGKAEDKGAMPKKGTGVMVLIGKGSK